MIVVFLTYSSAELYLIFDMYVGSSRKCKVR